MKTMNSELLSWKKENKKNIKLIHRVGLFCCVLSYFLFSILIIYLSSVQEFWLDLGNLSINKSILTGIAAQCQVIIAVLIVLNPIKYSKIIAVILNLFLGISALQAAVFHGQSDSLPGVVVAFSTIFVIIIISMYGKRLNSQVDKVIRYSLILKENEAMLHQLAYYDQLTELPNRKMMMDQMEILTEKTLKEEKPFIFVLFGIDNFKKVNDSAGHSVGDLILKQVSLRWRECVRDEDLLGRFGGDEFGLLIRRHMKKEELLNYVENFRSALAEVVTIGLKEYHISSTFGITVYPEDGKNTTELLKNADIVLNVAKNTRKNGILFFNQEMQGETLKRIQLENGLMSSIRKNELFLVFQPLYTCDSRKLRGFEALIRWRYPEMGLISPQQFIPIAEETGIIIDMGKWIIDSVLYKFMELKEQFGINPIVSINISVIQMIDPAFVPMIKDILKETGFDSNYLELEITESVFISYPDYIIEVIKQLKDLGIRIALDDFGTGYASLSYLQMLPINVLKIDKTFIDQIIQSESNNHIVGNIISLAHQLGIEVVAEGVEYEEQLNYLVEQKCDYIQGFLLSKPIEEEQLIKSYCMA